MKEASHYSMQSNDKSVLLLHINQPTNRGWRRKEIDLQGSTRRNLTFYLKIIGKGESGAMERLVTRLSVIFFLSGIG